MIGWLRKMLEGSPEPAEWTVSTGDEGGRPVILRTRVHAPRGMTSDQYLASVEIVWRFDGTASNGMPTSEVTALIMKCEEVLATLEDPTNGLLGIPITGNGRHEWVWYVADASAFSARATDLLAASGSRFPVDVRIAGAQQAS